MQRLFDFFDFSKTMLEWELSEKRQLAITDFLSSHPTNYLG